MEYGAKYSRGAPLAAEETVALPICGQGQRSGQHTEDASHIG